MIKWLLKLLLLPFVIVLRLVFGIIKFIFFTQLLLTLLSLLLLAAVAAYFFNGGSETIPRLMNFFRAG